LRDIVRPGKDILDLILEAPHEGDTFCRVIPLNLSGITLTFCVIGREVVVPLCEHLQFSFCCHHTIWVPESCFQNYNQGSDLCQVDALIGDIGLTLRKALAH
jgi:hypothetical protein